MTDKIIQEPPMPPMANADVTFEQLGILPVISDLLARQGIKTPTPIQHQAIPSGIEGKDIVGIAQTGTGKTFAFGLPLLQRLVSFPHARALVVVPTRELAQQVDESLHGVAQALKINTAVLIGGESMNGQMSALRRNPRLVIATPGRLIDHAERRSIQLRAMTMVVLDEADRMLDMGFAPQIRKVMEQVAPKRQTMLFSATMPAPIMSMAHRYMSIPMRIEVAPAGTAARLVEQEVFVTDRKGKLPLLEKLLHEHGGTVLIFTRTKRGATGLCATLRKLGLSSAEIHSNRSQPQRKRALEDFKSGRIRILVATDIAARGIDVDDIELVVNYDLPENAEDYVHRIGRTGRAGKTGKAVSFAFPDERGKVSQIERLIRTTINTTKLVEFDSSAPSGGRHFAPRGGRGRSPVSRGGFRGGRRRP
ncbi:hypothetical protein CO046_01650 [Candidatus Peregrinibacteria bacterium CG_4_9_14_0_2_um_filter_53_11]|nr:MAG: hypothetical protein CO046_01650 [Candidatus Peregrinibacteria bacterium CG_4_9_14_0_2_um_filter_53_11]